VTANTVFYASTGPQLTLFGLDVAKAALEKRNAVVLPANVQYAWPHPSKRYLYVVSSDGGPGVAGTTHRANAFRIDPVSGSLQSHGEPQSLPSRPIHVSVDASGEYLLTAYNAPSSVCVHRLNADGYIGEAVHQGDKLDVGIYAHQIRTTPDNSAAILVTRGNNAADGKPEDPGALKLFAFKRGALSNLASIAPASGLGFGPRHFDFHSSAPWVYVLVERQNKLYTYQLQSDGVLGGEPLFVKDTLADPINVKPGQGAGAIHVHPNGRFVYLTNRNQDEVDFQGRKVFNDGENNVAVFAIDEKTGEPNLIQTVEGHGIQLRTFGIDPSGRLLLAASIKPLLMREGNAVKTLSAGITVYRINADGTLAFVRKYDVDTGKGQQFWSGVVALA
jgi:6-phosphogluconolactonase (cycloisomerase 2 family)